MRASVNKWVGAFELLAVCCVAALMGCVNDSRPRRGTSAQKASAEVSLQKP